MLYSIITHNIFAVKNWYRANKKDHVPLQWRHNGPTASQITSLTIVSSTVCSGTDQRKHQNSASTVNSPHKGAVMRKLFPFDDVIMLYPKADNDDTACGILQTIHSIGILYLFRLLRSMVFRFILWICQINVFCINSHLWNKTIDAFFSKKASNKDLWWHICC